MLLHEESTVVNDRSSEKALNNELLAFEFRVHLNCSVLQEEELRGVVTRLLEDVVLLVLGGLESEDDIVEALVLEGGEVWHGLHTALDKAKHAVVVLVDAKLDLVLNARDLRDDFIERGNVQSSQCTVLACYDLSSAFAAVYEGNLAEVLARTQLLDILVLFFFVILLLLVRLHHGVLLVLTDKDFALTLGDEVHSFSPNKVFDDDLVRLGQVSFHSTHDRVDVVLLEILHDRLLFVDDGHVYLLHDFKAFVGLFLDEAS